MKSANCDESLTTLRSKCLKCVRCSIGGCDIDGHVSNVFSNMNFDARVMVVGQNPGHVEVERGFPFVGPSGEFFDNAIKEVLGVGREAFYITNVVKCFTNQNRAPHDAEIMNCREYLDEEIRVMNPNLVVTLGGPSLKAVAGLSGITKYRGQVVTSVRYAVRVLPLWHPSPLNMNSSEKRAQFYQDLLIVKQFLE